MTDSTITSTTMLSKKHPQDGNIVLNSKIADSSSKIIFDNNILCSQFLRDYIDLPCLKNVQPEDIEDVSELYVPLFAEERNADRVKKVHIKNENPFFLVSLIEHKSTIDYNVSMQIFRYMIYIWENEQRKLAKEQQKRAEKAEKQVENGIQAFIKTCQELGASKENTLQRVQENFELAENEAWDKIRLFWKD